MVSERLLYGALFGLFVGALSGATEYLMLAAGEASSLDLSRAYWDIVPLYAGFGLAAGLLVAAALILVLGAAGTPRSREHATLLSAIVALVALGYAATWVTYWLGPPLRAAHAGAWLVALVVAALAGLVVRRLLIALLGRLDGPDAATGRGVRRAAVVVAVLTLVVLVVPPVYSAAARSSTPAVARAARPADGQRPNIVFILLDATRADHLPMYGYSRPTAPHLTELAKGGVVLDRMYAQSSWTKPSIATIFSSLYPSVHKVTRERDFLGDGVNVLPEMLRAAGYKTFGVSANANVSPIFGYSQGFDAFRVWKTESAIRLTMMGRIAQDVFTTSQLRRLLGERGEIIPRAEVLTDLTLDWVSRSGDGPFFLYVHYIDPHTPYSPPPPYDTMFDHRAQPPRRAGGVDPLALLASDRSKAEVGRILDLYDGEIVYADLHVGRLLHELGARGILDNAIVVVTADHGEEFWEHGNEEHGKSAYEEVLRVPFIISAPGRLPAGSRVTDFLGLIDVAPTLLTLAGIEPPKDIQGRSFAGIFTRPEERRPDRKLFAQAITDAFALEMVRDQRYKLVRHLHGPRAGQVEMYDLHEDPLERTDIAARSAPRVQTFAQDLDAFNRLLAGANTRFDAQQVQRLDPQTERALRSLGYIK
jgi:arylsulfatase A-like enzyme